MGIRLSGDISDVQEGVNALLSGYPFAARAFQGEIVVSRLGPDAPDSFVIRRADHQTIHIAYRRRCDFFRALGCVLAGETDCYRETAVYEKNGVMLDLSRDAVYTVCQMKQFLSWLSLCGLNTCYLYMEDTYKLDKYPYWGYLRGAYSKEELKEMDDFAYHLGIELIPCIQTLSHLTTALRWDCTANIRDTANTLMVGQEETYNLIREMFLQLKQVFRTNRIHIGMDEAMDLGTGMYLRKKEARPQFDIMLEHLNRVAQIAEEMDLIPIIWDDMFYRAKNEDLDYYNPATKMTEEDIARVPENVQLAYWDYYHNTQEEYACLLEQRKGFSQHLIFAGGIWKWNGLVPSYGKTFTTTRAALNACKQNKQVDEIMATMWADNGAETPLQTVWPGLILFGQYAYDADTSDASIDRRCIAFTGLPLKGFQTIEKLDLLDGCENPNVKTRNPSKYFLYQDLLLGAFDCYAGDRNIPAHYTMVSDQLRQLRITGEKAPAIDRMLDFYTALADVLAQKSTYGREIRSAYQHGDREKIASMRDELDRICSKIEAMHDIFTAMWCDGTKGAGLEVHDIRMGGLMARTQTVKKRLTMYLNGDLERLDELEEERLPFRCHSGNDDTFPCCNEYQLIATQNPI